MFYWTTQDPVGSFTSIPGMDPRADYLLGPGFDDFQPAGPDAPIPFLLVAHSQFVVDFVNALLQPGRGTPMPAYPICYQRHRGGNFQIGDTITLTATRAFFEALARPGDNEFFRSLREAPKQIQLSLPLDPQFLQEQDEFKPFVPIDNPDVKPPECGWPRDTVIVGIIDDGIAFANARFRTSDQNTRVQCFWHQDGRPLSPTVQYGSELSKPEIDNLLQTSQPSGVIDEDLVYRRAHQIDYQQPLHKSAALRLAHGTHVLDLAAGADPATPPTNRPIIAVQLPVAATAKQTGAGLEVYVENAISYIQDRARALAGSGPSLPVVINFSYGTLTGSHDGTWLLDQAMDSAIKSGDPITRIVLASGNSNLDRGHQKIQFCSKSEDEPVKMQWRVQPDGTAPAQLQIWMPWAGKTQPSKTRVFITITPPDFVTSPPLGEISGSGVILERDGEHVCTASYSFQPTVTERGVFNICLHPTARWKLRNPPKQVASSGIWTITLHNQLLEPEQEVHAWIERDGLVYGYPRRGRQSYFVDPTYQRFDDQGRRIDDDPLPPVSNVRRAGMLNALATAHEVDVVGGFQRKDWKFAPYSAGGPISPTRDESPSPTLVKPDALSVSDDSYVHFGVLAAGTRTGSTVPMLGTSVAAPQVTREIADQLANGAAETRADLEAFAAAEEAKPPPKPPVTPEQESRAGKGRINFPETMQGPRTRYWLP